jgi:hypothetical protein
MPSYLPDTLTYISYFMLFLAILSAFAASYESKILLLAFYILSAILLARLSCLVLEVNFFSLLLSDSMYDKCSVELMP